MSVLIISSDYASHYFPLSALGAAWRDAGHGVVVATGPNLAERVRADGFEHRELVLGAGSNPGLIRAEKQPRGEDDHLRAFFEATRQGMVATLRYQAEGRLRDLLWCPLAVARRLREILAEVRPRVVLSDQFAFFAAVALRGLAHPYVSFVPGHPVSLPGPGELFGFSRRAARGICRGRRGAGPSRGPLPAGQPALHRGIQRGTVPDQPAGEHWLVRPYLPQVAVLRHVDLVICHGGNNTVTEALTAGLPLVVGPFSTDQFAGAADVRRAGLGEVFDPNRTTPGENSAVVEKALTGGHRRRAAALGRTMCADPGPERARRLCLASPG